MGKSLLEEARQRPRRLKGPACDVIVAIAQRPDLEVDIRMLIAATDITQTRAAEIFAAHGLHIEKHTIGRHRNNECLNCRKAGVIV